MSSSCYYVGAIYGRERGKPSLCRLWEGILDHHSLAIGLQDVPLQGTTS